MPTTRITNEIVINNTNDHNINIDKSSPNLNNKNNKKIIKKKIILVTFITRELIYVQ